MTPRFLALSLLAFVAASQAHAQAGNYRLTLPAPGKPFTDEAKLTADGRFTFVKLRQTGQWKAKGNALIFTPITIGGRTRADMLKSAVARPLSDEAQDLRRQMIERSYKPYVFRKRGKGYIGAIGSGPPTVTLTPTK